MICPVCGQNLESVFKDTTLDHAVACGLIAIVSDRFICACGLEALDIADYTNTHVMNFIRHCEHKPHDWPRLLTRKALEEF